MGNSNFGSSVIQRTHRVAYALAHDIPLTDIKSIPELDHLCRVTLCCAPAHLEPVSHAENIRRGDWANNRGKTECIRGHEFTPENTRTYRNAKGGWSRSCRTCTRDKYRAAYDPIAERERKQRYKRERELSRHTAAG